MTKIVFLSYSHDSEEHKKKVLGLSERLRKDGFETRLDQYVNGTPVNGWPRWMLDQADEADRVLLICTETYYRRFRGHEEPVNGKGGDWEGAIITQEIYNARSQTKKFVPILFEASQAEFVPEPVRGHTHYVLSSDERYEDLREALLDQAGVEPGPIGNLRVGSRRTAESIVFGERAFQQSVNVVPTRQTNAARLTLESNNQLLLERGLENVAQMFDGFGPDPLTIEVHTERASEELARIKQRRAWDPAQARGQIRQLLERVRSGDLTHADRTIRSAVAYWAARLLASEPDDLEEAKGLRNQLHQLDTPADTRIVDALIMVNEGDGDGALRTLRDTDDPDVRSSFFSILLKVRDRAAALEWFDDLEERQNPLSLTGIGWSNVAVTLAQADRWEEASAYLAKVNHTQQDEWPDILFHEGVINAALLLPIELRQHALEMNLFHPGLNAVEGPQADRHREYAITCFQKAEERLAMVLPERSLGTRPWLYWLRLTHPDPSIKKAAREELLEAMKAPAKALYLLSIARAFDIPFDAERLKNYIEKRARLGGLTDQELQARFLLAEVSLGPADLIAFLDEEESGLHRVFPARLIIGKRIEALVEGGQLARARSLLEGHKDDFEEDDQQRIEALIEAREGTDPRPRLERNYETNRALLDLHNLAQHLRQIEDWPALRPHLMELFRRERTLKNARRLAFCTLRDPGSNDSDIITFLQDNCDLTERDLELTSAKAWALFRVGRLNEAQTLNDQLLSKRSDSLDLQLEINLSLQSGAWEHFSGMVEREWVKREERDPKILMQLASLAAESNRTSSRAIELLQLAATKGYDDPSVLMGAIVLTFRLGREGEELRGWFAQAIALSSEEGPIKVFDLRTVIEELMPAHRERKRLLEEHWRLGTIPLHIVGSMLNIPLSNLLIGLPRRNELLQDGRHRAVIPIISGAREPVTIQSGWSVGLDVSSLMVLTHLNLLRRVIDGFRRIILAPDTMLVLLNERNRVRSHQPSLVKRAEEILALIGSGQLRIDESFPTPPRWLTEEVGSDLAQLLEAAQGNQGCVVRPRPVHKLHSLLEEDASLAAYDSCVLSTVALERLLHQRGYLDEESHQRTANYLRLHDQDTGPDADIAVLDHPIYLDDLAASYLQSAGLLNTLVNYNLDLRIHSSLRQEQHDLVSQYRAGEQLAETIEEMRLVLRDALQTRKAEFLARHELEEKAQSFLDAAPTLAQFTKDLGICDALVIDDRFTNGNPRIVDETGKAVPSLCVLDILRFLAAQGTLTPTERQTALHRLRLGGFAFVPVEIDELKRLLASNVLGADGKPTESAELRTIRQDLSRIRSLDMLRHPQELTFLGYLWRTSSLVIRELWIDEGVAIERAVDLTDWIWLHVMPSPLDWHTEARDESFVGFLHQLLHPQPLRGKRREAFLAWLEVNVLAPMAPANAGVLDQLGELTGQRIKEWGERIVEDGTESLVTEYLIGLHPPSIRKLLLKNEALRELLGIQADFRIVIGDRLSVANTELFAAARRLLERGGEAERLYSQEEGQASISQNGGSIFVQISPQAGENIDVPFDELGVLSSDPQVRTRVLDQCLQRIGPTGPDFASLQHAALERQLTDGETDKFLQTLWDGVTGTQERLQIRLEAGSAKLWDLVPDSLDYFERFCGPNPDGTLAREYLSSVLPDYRKGLLRKHLGQGLKICLQGALRDDLCPGAWLEEVGEDELWAALQTCRPQLEPFSLLAALDIALYRLYDERFRAFAEEAVDKLMTEQFQDASGFDLYQVLPFLAQLTLDRINLSEGGMLRAPFWKRMCSWMQASMALRLLLGLDIDFAKLCNQIKANLQPVGGYIRLLDLQREPMYQSSELTPTALRNEVWGRLLQLKGRHQAAGREITRSEDLAGLEKGMSPLNWGAPGPLEGFQRPEEVGSVLEQRTKDEIIKLSGERLLSNMATLAQFFHFDEETLSFLHEVISNCSPENIASGPEDRLWQLANAGLVAAAERDQNLASAIAEGVFSLAPALQEGAVSLALQDLLIASAAFEEEAPWAEWLEEQLARLAGLLPAGKATSRLYDVLQALKGVMKLHLGITVRAEALASAASSFL